MGGSYKEMILNNYGQHIKDLTDGEIFEIYVGMAKIWTDIDRLIWVNIEEGETGSGVWVPISVRLLAIPT